MTPIENAFLDADFNWVMALQSLWSDSPAHVPGLHAGASDAIMRDFKRLAKPNWTPSLGKVIVGPPGAGKTHLISDLRRRVWDSGGWFVFIDIVGIKDFWQTTVLGFIESLRQPMKGLPQYESVFNAALKTIDREKAKAVALESEDLGEGAAGTVNLFVKLLKVVHPQGQQYADVVRALLLQRDPETMDIAYAWLQGLDVPEADRSKLGLAAPPPAPAAIVRGISWLMSLSGPTMVAIDQIDSIVAAGNIAKMGAGDGEIETKAKAIIELFAGGLMDLNNQTHRSMTVLSCFPETWDIITEKTMKSVGARFGIPPINLTEDQTTAPIANEIIVRRLAEVYGDCDVPPPSPIWPFNQAFCEEMKDRLVRQVLMRCEQHRVACLNANKVVEWPSEGTVTGGKPSSDLDDTFAQMRADVEVPGADALYFDEGNLLGELVKDSLLAYARHLSLSEDVDVEIVEDKSAKPVLHARLKFTFLSEKGLEKHFCFRVLGQTHPRAFQARLAAAITSSGIDEKLPFRHLFVLRAVALPGGKVTNDLRLRFEAGGGVFHNILEDDLRSMLALRRMSAAKIPGFEAWMRERNPFCGTAFFELIGLCPPPVSPVQARIRAGRTDLDLETPSDLASRMATIQVPERQPSAKKADLNEQKSSGKLDPKSEAQDGRATAIPLGPRLQGGGIGPVETLSFANLVRHSALFAGSGSGKTMLLRRIVEEAALAGIPAIVLDTNNDLARLGQAWPQRPASFTDEDAEKAARYAREVEVVVWTPGRASGRPLTLAVLPDFAAAAEGEESDEAVDMAQETLSPLVGARGATGELKLGVLKEALATFAREGRTGIEAFIDFLSDLPDGVSRQRRAVALAADMSDQLRAKIAINPLLNATGQPLDPAVLFTASRPGATRISVINFSGLAADASRQDFVNQLQMALFTFIRRYPSTTPRLYVCDEAQNFAPSSGSTASKASAVALARQGRKFGLGMIFATQGPKVVDTNIVSNCLTHFYGRMASTAHLDATEEMMASRGRAAKDLGSLTAGTFYFSTEGTPAPVKLKTPFCLSFHDKPATPEEVVALARA